MLNLAALGFTATCNPGGAGKWKPEYSDSLKGKHVILVPDNDRPGREHMAKVGAALADSVASLKWLDLPDLPTSGDVSDFIAKFQDKDEARERLTLLVENAKPYDPPRPKTLEDAVFEVGDFLNISMPPKRVFLHPWLTEQSITLIPGWRNVGKTFFALSILDAVSCGKSFGPWEAGEPVPTLFLDGEMAAQDIVSRCNELGITSNKENPLYIYSDAWANHLGLPRANLANESWRSAMFRILKTRGVKLWVVDNIGSLTPGIDENSRLDWTSVNDWLLYLRFAGIGTLLLHHTTKGGLEQRGTSAREDNIDSSILLKRPGDYFTEDGCRFVAKFTKSRVPTEYSSLVADVEFQLTKGKDGKTIWAWQWAKRQNKAEILRLLNEGAAYSSIMDTLGISKGYVSRVKREAIDEGLLTAKGKLSKNGMRLVYGDEIGDSI